MSRAFLRSVQAIFFASFIVILPQVSFADDPYGWYLGLGAGWDHAGTFNELPANVHVSTDDAAFFVGSFGYKWSTRVRLEVEIGYDHHDVQSPFTGNTTLTTGMVNGMFDMPIAGPWGVSLGGGLGAGSFHFCTAPMGFPCTGATETHLVGQIIAEMNARVTERVVIFVQGRERFIADSSRVKDADEQAALIGIRLFLNPMPMPGPSH